MDIQLQARALTEPPVFWKNGRCIRIHSGNGKVGFVQWFGGPIYSVSQEQWDSGQLTEVH